MKLSPLIEELVAATVAVAGLIGVISLAYWLITGLSPWPTVVVAQIVGFGSGIGVLTLTSPRRRRS